MFYWPNKPIRIYDNEKLVNTLPLENWIVQPKWDGKRLEISCDAEGRLMFFGRQGQRWASVAEEWGFLVDLHVPKPWFLDGELLRDGRIFVWDYAQMAGVAEFRKPYWPRLQFLQENVLPMVVNGHSFSVAETLQASEYKKLLLREGDPMLEGIVFKSRNATNLWGPHNTTQVNSQFKYRFKG